VTNRAESSSIRLSEFVETSSRTSGIVKRVSLPCVGDPCCFGLIDHPSFTRVPV
jgi:hypothetical protein